MRALRSKRSRPKLLNEPNNPAGYGGSEDVLQPEGARKDKKMADPTTLSPRQIVAELDRSYDAWWSSALPLMVNENAPIPAENPFKTLYEQQFGTDAAK